MTGRSGRADPLASGHSSRPSLAELWGERDPVAEYAAAQAKGPAALDELYRRRKGREDRYYAPIRAAVDKARRAQEARRNAEEAEQRRQRNAARMRAYRARLKARLAPKA